MNKSPHLYLSRSVAPAPSGLLRVVVRRAWATFALWIARSNQRSELYELDERLLRDIGISREQALAEAQKPFWR